MKKLLYSFMAAGAVAGLASCASDEPMMSGSNDGRVSISVEIPRFSTRAYGDTLNCNQLIYTVYDATGETVIFPDSAVNAFGAGINSANITLQLVPGETYTLVCYAHNTGSQFSSYKEGNITVDYTKLTANDENHDAFYRAIPITVDGQGDKKITLNRAFAQINFGTNDLNNPAVQKVIGNFEAKLNITSGLYNTLSCKDSTVSNSDDLATTLAVNNKFTQNSNFPVPGYGNLTSVYVLVGADAGQLLGEGTYVINNGATEVRNVNLASTPVRMNYRTNVYGAMLTTDLPVTVELNPYFVEPGYSVDVTDYWDGESMDIPVKNEDGIYEINSAAALAGLADMMKSSTGFRGETFVLNTSVDMGGNVFEGFGPNNANFQGTFDGQGNTIRNFQTVSEDKNQADYGCALFPRLSGTVKNLVVENVTVGKLHSGNVYGNMVGAVAGYLYGYLENVTVRNCIIYGYGKVGGLVGMFEGTDTNAAKPRIKDCTVENCTIYGAYNSAGVVGLAQTDMNMSNWTVKNNKLEPAPYPGVTWVHIGPTTATDEAKNQRPDLTIDGYFWPAGSTYYATGATYYNRYDVLDREGYRVTYDGKQVEIDGYPINTLPTSN